MTESREKLVAYLLSNEYITLLESAVLSRITTTTNNHDKHEKAIHLIKDFKVDPENRVQFINS